MKTSAIVALIALSSESRAQVLFPMPSKYNNQLNEVLKPVFDALEPYKTEEYEKERGVPLTHEPLDCAIHIHDK